MTVIWATAGAIGPTTATVRVRTDGASVSLAVADNASLAGADTYGPFTAVDGMATFDVTGLAVRTNHWYAPTVDNVSDGTVGRFVTDPPSGEPSGFGVVAFSCAGSSPEHPGVGSVLASDRVSNSPQFAEIAARWQWQRIVHMGDWTYYDLGSDNHGISGGSSVANLRRMVDDFAGQPNQRTLYLDNSTVFINDDHELNNNHDRTDPGLPRLRQVVAERFPSPATAAPGTLYREERIARCHLVYWDCRSGRDPNSQPDGANKSMLGAAQRFAFEATLATSPAKFMLIFSSSVWWEPGRADGWASFATEQQWVIDTIAEHGWTGRVAIVCGDVHALGMDSGGNSPGGIPTVTFASIDSAFGASLDHNDLGPTHPGRDQYGLVWMSDLGDTIDVHFTGIQGRDVVQEFTYTADVPPDPPPPLPPIPPTVAVPVPTHVVEYVAVDAVTGELVAYLPGVTGRISRALGAYTTSTLTLPIPTAGPLSPGSALLGQVMDPWRTMIVAVVNDAPAWAGYVVKPVGGTAATVSLATVTPEAYLKYRYVPNLSYSARDQTSVILAGLVGSVDVEGIGLLVDAPESGTLRSRRYVDTDDATVYDRARELMAVSGGPEWTVDLDWVDTRHTAVRKIFRARPRIGVAVPRVTFATLGRSAASYTLRRDYSTGRGSNHVVAYSSGEGPSRPQSSPARAEDLLASGMPRVEYRYSPSSAIKDAAELAAHAGGTLARIAHGTHALDVAVRWDAEPRWGIDWRLGDQANLDLYGHLHPDGLTATARIIGWGLDPLSGVIEPKLRM